MYKVLSFFHPTTINHLSHSKRLFISWTLVYPKSWWFLLVFVSNLTMIIVLNFCCDPSSLIGPHFHGWFFMIFKAIFSLFLIESSLCIWNSVGKVGVPRQLVITKDPSSIPDAVIKAGLTLPLGTCAVKYFLLFLLLSLTCEAYYGDDAGNIWKDRLRGNRVHLNPHGTQAQRKHGSFYKGNKFE